MKRKFLGPAEQAPLLRSGNLQDNDVVVVEMDVEGAALVQGDISVRPDIGGEFELQGMTEVADLRVQLVDPVHDQARPTSQEAPHQRRVYSRPCIARAVALGRNPLAVVE
jgi:hypothetical protein